MIRRLIEKSKKDAIIDGIEEPPEVKHHVTTKLDSHFCKAWNKFDENQRHGVLKDIRSTIGDCVCKETEPHECDSEISDDPQAYKWNESETDTDREMLGDETSNQLSKDLAINEEPTTPTPVPSRKRNSPPPRPSQSHVHLNPKR